MKIDIILLIVFAYWWCLPLFGVMVFYYPIKEYFCSYVPYFLWFCSPIISCGSIFLYRKISGSIKYKLIKPVHNTFSLLGWYFISYLIWVLIIIELDSRSIIRYFDGGADNSEIMFIIPMTFFINFWFGWCVKSGLFLKNHWKIYLKR